MSKRPGLLRIFSWSLSFRRSNRSRCIGSNLWGLFPSCIPCSRRHSNKRRGRRYIRNRQPPKPTRLRPQPRLLPGRRPWLKRRRCPSYLLPWQPRNRGSCVHSMGWKPKRKQPGTSPGDASNSYLTQARPACQCRLCVGYHFGYWDASLELPGRPGDTISAAGFPTGRARPTRGRSWTTSRPGERGRVFSSRTFSFQRESGAARQRGFDRRTSMVQAQRFGLVSGRNWPHNAGDVPAARHREPTVSDIGGYDSQRGTTWHLPIGSVRNGGTRTRRFASQR